MTMPKNAIGYCLMTTGLTQENAAGYNSQFVSPEFVVASEFNKSIRQTRCFCNG